MSDAPIAAPAAPAPTPAAAPPPAPAAAPPPAASPPAPAAPPLDARGRKELRKAALSKPAGQPPAPAPNAAPGAPAAPPATPSAPPPTAAATAPAPQGGDKPAEAPKPGDPPAEAKPPEPAPPAAATPGESREDLLRRLRDDREKSARAKALEREKAESEKTKQEIESRRAELAKDEDRLKLARAIEEARGKKDVVAAVKAALPPGVELTDVLMEVARAIPDSDLQGPDEPETPPGLSPEEIAKTVEAQVTARLAAEKEAEKAARDKRVSDARADFMKGATEALEADIEKFPRVAQHTDPDKLEKVVMEASEEFAAAEKRWPTHAEALRAAEVRLFNAAQPAACNKEFVKDPTRYPAVAKFGADANRIAATAAAMEKKLGRFPTAAETLQGIEDDLRESVRAVLVATSAASGSAPITVPNGGAAPPPPAPAPSPGVTGDWRATSGAHEQPVPGALVSDRKAARMQKLREMEAQRKAAKA